MLMLLKVIHGVYLVPTADTQQFLWISQKMG
jgi:hypothetical protein